MSAITSLGGSQFAHTSREAIKLSSLDGNLIPHDMRKGAARDVAAMPFDGLERKDGLPEGPKAAELPGKRSRSVFRREETASQYSVCQS